MALFFAIYISLIVDNVEDFYYNLITFCWRKLIHAIIRGIEFARLRKYSLGFKSLTKIPLYEIEWIKN